ncbi:hypothetical protein HXX01_03910 [Candidatus Nomurabacteria bacterium]|nr:hypothetical protein [Candidatus Nomurabacteria bacterium]
MGFTIFIFILVLLPTYNASAATIGFSPSSSSHDVGDTINVKVYVGTDSKSVNAISANIKFSNDVLSLSSISKSGSIINLWAQEPSFSNGDGVASFEGVVLNGYTGNSGEAVTLVFRAKAAGTAKLSFNNASILANDGNGTEVLYSKGTGSIKVSQVSEKPIAVAKTSVKKEEAIVKTPKIDTTIAISEIKNNTNKYSPNKFLITSSQVVADRTYTIQIDSNPSIIWTDDGTHIFQAGQLTNGMHTIKVMAVDVNSNALSGFLNFSTTVLKVPEMTYYPTDLYVDQFMVLKGIADPAIDVELTITNINTGGIIIDHIFTNSDGKFTYVPDNKMVAGNYSVIARAIAANGITSDYMNPIQVVNKEHQLNFFVSKMSNVITLVIPLLALLALVIILAIYLYYRIRKYRQSLEKRLSVTEKIVSKSFEILDEDLDEEVEIFKKIRSAKILDKDEQIFLSKFKKDIKEAEKVIEKELKQI